MIELQKPLRPLALVILDGWGLAAPSPANAISLAQKPYLNAISVAYPHTQLTASGESVGLPKGEAGNSEVGHLNIGAGKIVYQDEPRINSSIADGTFLSNDILQRTFAHVRDNKSSLHLMGLIGTGRVHSSVEHLYALLWVARESGVSQIFLHLFTDGRDSSPTAGLQILDQVQNKIASTGVGKIATISGRYWAMDRDKHWDRIAKTYEAVVHGVGPKTVDPRYLIENSYRQKVTDEFIEPTVIDLGNGQIGNVKNNDAIIFFNFRPDRARQLTKAFVLPNFIDFNRGQALTNISFTTMAEYEKGLPVSVAFPHQEITQPLAKVVSDHLLKQLHIGESEKYAHVTYFVNGGREDPYPLEDRVHIPSPKVKTYDLKPEMSAVEITEFVLNKMRTDSYQFYVINFANPDMVGHTGSISATVKGIETVDTCLKKIGDELLLKNGAMVVTADHGNAEVMLNPSTWQVDTEHSTNPVPLIVVAKELQNSNSLQMQAGILADVAPTILALMGITKPGTMVGQDLLGIRILNQSL